MTFTAEGSARMTLRIDAPTAARLDEYHRKTEIPKTRIVNKALRNYLDELEEDYADARTGEAAGAEHIAGGGKTYTLDELEAEFGL